MTIDPDILAAQQAYDARPYAACVLTSHSSACFRFDTEAQAIDYVFQQFATVRRRIATREFAPSWVGFDCYRSYIEGPHGRVQAKYVLFADSLSSH